MSKDSLVSRMIKSSTVKLTNTMEKTDLYKGKRVISTNIPAINIALSGEIDGGFKGGVGIIGGPSRHFKSGILLVLVSAFMKKYEDGVVVFYDSEHGMNQEMFDSYGVDTSRLIHTPVMNLEEFRTDIMNQLQNVERGENVMFIVDSTSNLPSLKETEDSIDGKNVADFSKAKVLKSIFRLITPILSVKDIPFVAVSHTYDTMEMFSKQVLSGGKGQLYASDWCILLGRQQEKEGTELTGYNFIMNIEKSRMVKEKSKVPLEVRFDGGISKWSGLLDIALNVGCVIKPSNGWYSRVDDDGVVEEKKWRLKDSNSAEFWKPMLSSKIFQNKVKEAYKLSSTKQMISYDDEEFDEVDSEEE